MRDWTQPTSPGAIQRRPWMSPWAEHMFGELLYPGIRVVEFGSGGSTLWLRDHAATVLVSYETRLEWVETMVIHGEIPCLWDGLTMLDIPEHDLLYVDGDPYEFRPLFAAMAWPSLLSGGWMVLDNSNERRLGTMRADYITRSSEFLAVEHQPRPCGFCETGFFRKG